MKTEDFKPGDLLKITWRSKRGDDSRAAVVREIAADRVVFYDGYTDGLLPSGQGSFCPATIGTTPYGIVAVEVIGRQPMPQRWAPKPGDRGYDLMC